MCFDYLACLLVLARVSRVSDQHLRLRGFVGAAPGDPCGSVQYQLKVQLFHPSAGSVRALRHPAPRRSAGLYYTSTKYSLVPRGLSYSIIY